MAKYLSITKSKNNCPCGAKASISTDAGHGLELHLCSTCKARLDKDQPIKVKIDATRA